MGDFVAIKQERPDDCETSVQIMRDKFLKNPPQWEVAGEDLSSVKIEKNECEARDKNFNETTVKCEFCGQRFSILSQHSCSVLHKTGCPLGAQPEHIVGSCTQPTDSERENGGQKSLGNSNLFPCDKCQRTFVTRVELNGHNVSHVESSASERNSSSIKEDAASSKSSEVKDKEETGMQIKMEPIFDSMSEGTVKVEPDFGSDPKDDATWSGELSVAMDFATNTPGSTYPCDLCGKAFTAPNGLRAHKHWHKPQHKEYRCETCDRSFRHSVHLFHHQRSHAEMCRCDICGRTFTKRGHLVFHARMHNQRGPYGCEVCGKMFEFAGSLVQHKQKRERCNKHKPKT